VSRVRAALLAGLLALPTVLAFATGGYFDEPRLWAAVAVWAGVLVVVVAAVAEGARARGAAAPEEATAAAPLPRGVHGRVAVGAPATAAAPLPRGVHGRVAVGALAAFAAWTGLSTLWAPLSEPASDDAQRAVLYAGALVLATALARGRGARWVVPALAAGALVVIAYALAGRILPSVVELSQTRTAAGRLEQPLTYWNATGLLAAVGAVLCVGLAGDRTRPAWLRAAATPAAVVLLLGVYLSFSRGALGALALGLAAAVLLAPSAAALRAAGLAVAGGALASVVASQLHAVRALEGAQAAAQGAVMGVVLAALVLGALALASWVRAGDAAAPPRPPRALVLGGGAAAVVAVVAVVAITDRGPGVATPATGATASRLASADSNRYAYWRVAVGEAADAPLHGHGAGSFRVAWLRERDLDEPVRDAHSLPLETLAELGLAGLVLLLAAAGAVALAARRAGPSERVAAAALLAWAAHACIDWDWELPAVTLPALVLSGLLLARAERVELAQPGPGPGGQRLVA